MSVSRTSAAREATRRMRRLELQIGEDVRRLRLDAGLSLTNLAEMVGVHRSHIARIDRRPPARRPPAVPSAAGACL